MVGKITFISLSLFILGKLLYFCNRKRGFSSSGRASGSQSEGGRFESGNLHEINEKAANWQLSLFLQFG